MANVREIRFNMFEWHHIYNEIKDKPPMVIHNARKKHFKGDGFSFAFPLMGIETPYHWSLTGTVITEEGGEYEFEWKPDGKLTFTQLMYGSAVAWAKSMHEIAGGEHVISIECIAEMR